jgi:excisionase family DNA binding protein
MNSPELLTQVSQVDTDRSGMKPSEPSHSVDDCALWSTEELANYLGCTSRHVARLRVEGLPVIRVGHLVRFMPNRVIEWLDSRPAPARPGAATP